MSTSIRLYLDKTKLEGSSTILEGHQRVMSGTAPFKKVQYTESDWARESPFITCLLEDTIPRHVLEMVVRVTTFIQIPRTRARRESGVYEHGNAVCELMPSTTGEPFYTTWITSRTVKDVIEIVDLIKTGKIRPTKSYDEPQVGIGDNMEEPASKVAKGPCIFVMYIDPEDN